jgi:hypothetical protein
VRRAYKLRAYPTRPQEVRAVRLLADHCDLYNAALQERREAWRMAKVSVAYGDQSAQLKEIRAADPDGQGRHSFTAQQQTLRRLNVVFAAYYKRVRGAEKGWQQAGRGEKPKERTIGYPRFSLASASTKCCSSLGTAPGGNLPIVAAGRMRPPRSTATPAGPDAAGPDRTPSSAPSTANWMPTSTGPATSPPGPGWAPVKPPWLEKLPTPCRQNSHGARLLGRSGSVRGGPITVSRGRLRPRSRGSGRGRPRPRPRRCPRDRGGRTAATRRPGESSRDGRAG